MKKATLLFLIVVLCAFFNEHYAQNSVKDIQTFLDQKLESNQLLPLDAQWEITDQNTSRGTGVQHIYFRQLVNGIPVYGTESGIHFLPGGKLLQANERFIRNAADRSSAASPSLTAAQAVESAASLLNYNVTEKLSILERKGGVTQEVLLSDGGISLSPIPAKLVYQLDNNGQLVLSWDISIQEKSQQEWYSLRINAISGEIVDKANWMVSCSFEHDHSEDHNVLNYNDNLYDIPNYKELIAEENAACGGCYEVFAMPLESPYFGTRTTETLPADPTASPFGWHDTDGVAGAEFTVTRGNNVNAYEDGNNPGYQPDGGALLDFTGFPFNQVYTGGNQYEDAAITNLFYWNNIIHDVMYQYGFDEAGGNFQENNYGNGGSGSDSVNAEAQDGSGSCNANFGTPPDGGNPQMQMYVCGDKDGDFDNLVITHEYGHGISNRLTGGPAASGCLQNSEQMGEGWSDFFGVILTIEPGDTGTDSRAVGTYLFGQGPGGGGIRSFPYSTDFGVNPHTYDDIKTEAVPHGVGSVWAAMLWEMTWELVGAHGFDPNIYNFTGDVNLDAGNVMALALVIEGLKLQPCSPGFVDGRDAILAADAAIYGGANECLIWDAFARRGLGLSADQGSSGSRSDGTEAFDTPSGVAQITAPNDVCFSSDVLTGLGGGSPFGGVYSGPGVTDDGNGSTYSFDIAAAGVGVHTISYEVQAGACSVASTATDDIEVLAVPNGPTTTGAMDICVGDTVTVTATPNDPANVIRWFDAPTGGNFLAEGTSYAFNPTSNVTVYAQENPPGPLSTLVISELTFETPDRLEIQNVGVNADYTGYAVALSDQPYTNINSMNSVVQMLGPIGQDSVFNFNDDGGAGYWGSNIWWGTPGTGWVIIIDDLGNVVDSVFWNFTAAEIATLNVTINGFNITAADLDWTGDGASLTATCSGSFRRTGDTDSDADWSGVCETSDFGVANEDIGIGFSGCLAERTPADVTVDAEDPVVTCPADQTETTPAGVPFSLPDYTPLASATDNCTASPILTQSPASGSSVGPGVTTVTITATDGAGNQDSCTFDVTVTEILGVGDANFIKNIVLYPNPTQGELILSNLTSEQLVSATITDVNGRIIQVIDLEHAGITTNINVEILSTGMYFVTIQGATTSVVKRIVKQ
ncbi:M36 family metallopeptidase [Constantimarinum furrinae]|uniref:Zinc metalloprotease n=1 Tax=Constantimarinum furrinae TaxID=2562285 RepID=A0A7G8PVV1_9FLAO|nr:M36 family metallopeptidase [Constantimarinum furrinae]QNJ98467.1 Zinc metalloprotease [Constantimarinum furrinae]